jgi:hypothetical protein
VAADCQIGNVEGLHFRKFASSYAYLSPPVSAYPQELATPDISHQSRGVSLVGFNDLEG